MTEEFTYQITLKVEREGILPIPVADFKVRGRLEGGEEFALQLGKTFEESLSRLHAKLEKARRKLYE